MSAKDVKFGDDARSRMLEGVNILANAVLLNPAAASKECSHGVGNAVALGLLHINDRWSHRNASTQSGVCTHWLAAGMPYSPAITAPANRPRTNISPGHVFRVTNGTRRV